MSAMWLVLARHGHAGRKDQWQGDDRLRPLDQRGRRQAAHLADVLEPLGPTRLVSSPYVRCTQTLDPLAERLGFAIELEAALVPDAAASGPVKLIRSLGAPGAASGVVACTHGEILGTLLSQLASQDHAKLARRPPGSKGCAWVLEFEDGKLTSSRYIPPGR